MKEPKKKAQELIDSFKSVRNIAFTVLKEDLVKANAKQCALKCVEDIIISHESYPINLATMASVSHRIDYWNKVLTELQKP